jgi:hypothetical protein
MDSGCQHGFIRENKDLIPIRRDSGMRKAIIMATSALVISGAAIADYQDFTITYDESDFGFETVTYDSTEYDLIVYKDGGMYAPPGEPSIPTKGFDVLIPYGSTDVTYELLDWSYTELEEEYYFWPGQLPRSLDNEEEPWVFTPPGDTYYATGPYPESVILDQKQGFIRGGFLCQFAAATVQYMPSSKTVRLYDYIELRVSWTPPEEAVEPTRFEWDRVYDYWGKLYEKTALNPEDYYDYREPVNSVDIMQYWSYEENGETIPVVAAAESQYYSLTAPDPSDTTSLPSEQTFPYSYVIITNDYAYHETGDPDPVDLTDTPELPYLIQWKNEKGIPATWRTVDWIKNNYEPEEGEYDDPQVRVRMFIDDAWGSWGTEFILIAGDVDPYVYDPPNNPYKSDFGKFGIVPIRVFNSALNGWDRDLIPTDVYYDCLDENWDKNNNHEWGQATEPPTGDDPSFKPDIALGWVPCKNKGEFGYWIDKLLTYEKDPPLETINGRTYLSRFAQVAADACLTIDPKSYGTRFLIPDYISPADYECYKIWEGYGPGGNPSNGYKIQWPTYPEPGDINDAINEGYGIVEIDTHGRPYLHYVLTQNEYDGGGGYLQQWNGAKDRGTWWSMIFPSSIAELDNGPRYPIAYSYSCNTNEFTKLLNGHVVSEGWLFTEEAGGVAYLGNTRSGHWTDGPNLARTFYRYLLNKTEPPQYPEQVLDDDDAYFLGITQIWSKYGYVINGGVDWHTVYTHMLDGDPEMNVYTGDPDKLAVGYSTEEGPGENETTVRVTVTKGLTQPPGPPVYVAYVCLYIPGDPGQWLTNITNDSGHCDFVINGSAVGAKITATKHNFVPGWATISGE